MIKYSEWTEFWDFFSDPHLKDLTRSTVEVPQIRFFRFYYPTSHQNTFKHSTIYIAPSTYYITRLNYTTRGDRQTSQRLAPTGLYTVQVGHEMTSLVRSSVVCRTTGPGALGIRTAAMDGAWMNPSGVAPLGIVTSVSLDGVILPPPSLPTGIAVVTPRPLFASSVAAETTAGAAVA